MIDAPELDPKNIDAAVMSRLRAPFGCEFIPGTLDRIAGGRWRIHDANDDAIASVSGREEGYARLIVQALNEHFACLKHAEDKRALSKGRYGEPTPHDSGERGG